MNGFRFYHAVLALFGLAAYVTGDNHIFPYHKYIGYTVAVCLVWRLLWPHRGAFSWGRFRIPLGGRDWVSIGHASILLGIALSISVACVSGMALDGGRTFGLSLSFVTDRHFWKEMHEVSTTLFLLFAVLHGGLLFWKRRTYALFMLVCSEKSKTLTAVAARAVCLGL